MEEEKNTQPEAGAGEEHEPTSYEPPRKKHIVREYAESIIVAAKSAVFAFAASGAGGALSSTKPH